MLRRLEHVLDLRPGELGRGILLFGYLFFVIGSFTVGKAVRDALFIDEFGAMLLPYADIAIAAIVGLWVSIYLRIARRVNVRVLLMGSLGFFAVNCLIFWYLTHVSDAAWLTPVIYVWVGMFGVVAPAQVWTLANYVVTTREAKRLFGFIGSGATAGWIIGGFLTRFTANRFGAESSLIGMAVCLVLAAVLVDRLWRRKPPADEGGQYDGQDPGAGLRNSLRLIAGSPYLRAIAAVILLSSFATAVIGWQFKAIVGGALAGRDELAAFFGTFNIYAGLASFALQWVLTGRLLRRMGLGFALFVVPVALSLGAVGLLVLGTLTAAVALRGIDQVLRYAVDKPTVELLYLPVPADLTLNVKSFIDTVVWRMGDGLAGVSVLLFAGWMGLGPVGMSLVTLVLLGAWIVAAYIAQRQYVLHLQDSIHHYRLDAERATATGLDRAARDLLARQLSGNEPAEVLYALRLLGAGGQRSSHPAVRGLLQHPSADVRAEAIRVLDEAGDAAIQPIVEKLLYDPELAVRTQALLYLAHHSRIDPLDRIEKLGEFSDFSIRAAMVSFLAQPGTHVNIDAARLLLDGMLDDTEPRTRYEAARLLELLPDHFEEQIRAVLGRDDPEQVRHAIQAVGTLRKRRLVGRVVDRLADPELSADAATALSLFGDRVVGTLRDHLVDPDSPSAVRRVLPQVLLQIGSQAAHQVLAESLLDPDVEVRYRIISALNKLQDLHPTWPIDRRMLETVLGAEILGHLRSYQVLGTLGRALADAEPVLTPMRTAMEQELERIFRLLKLLYPHQDLHSAYVGVQSTNPIVHDNALEFLENILPPELRTLLVPLLDSAIGTSQRVELAHRVLGARPPSETEAVRLLLQSDDPWLKSCGAYAVGALGLSELIGEVEALAGSPDPLLRETVRQARERVKGP
jgi:ATP:ADP antiporter, AAA family